MQAALDLIAEKGAAGFTFADAARAAGVSPAAPYRHFQDRDALVADIAMRGFERLTDDLERAWDEGQPNAQAAFIAIGRAYLAFANSEPSYFAAMFESGLPADADRDLQKAADRALAVLNRAAETLCAILPASSRPPARMVSLHMWSLSHGIASLFTRGNAARRKLPMAPDDLLEAGVLIYLQGLGLDGI